MADGGFRLIIPGWHPPGLNDLLHMHHMEVHRRKTETRIMILAALGRHRPEYKRARIRTTFYILGRMDKDNRESKFKAIGDALQRIQVIPNDDDRTIETVIVVEHAAHRCEIKTVIEITEIKGV
jgi:hypothetical protein